MLEDNPLDVSVIIKTLSRSPFETEYTIVHSGHDYIHKLDEQAFDLILCDYQLPDFNAIDALHARNQKNISIPFILVTGAVSEDVAINVLKEGANDYVLKDRLQRLPVAIEKALKKQQLKFDKQSLEVSLSELTDRFQLVAKTSFDVIWDYDIEKDQLYCSAAIEKIIGRAVKENFQRQFLKNLIPPDDIYSIERSLARVIKSTDNRWRKLFRLIRNDGSIAWVNINALILRNKHERAVRIVGVMHDITEVRKLQHELIEQQIENQRQITRVTLLAQEKERTEIGKELHDNVNQLLATAKIMIDTARNTPNMHDLCLSKSQEAIMEAIEELRNLAHSMMPPPFEKNDFKNILHDFAYKINLTGHVNLNLSLPANDELLSIDNSIKLTFYRIIQEQVSNILKYAKAKNVSVTIDVDDFEFTLLIEDDGVGFDPQKKSEGIGLKNIESRCNLFDGVMNLVTSPGSGCLIKISIPAKNAVYV
jgi:two-component system, NarL family, sensor histidine kinase UhpB